MSGQVCGNSGNIAVYKKLDGQDQVIEWWVMAYRGINSSGRVVKTVMQGLGFLFQTGGLIGLLM